jgi:hypothetical protein
MVTIIVLCFAATIATTAAVVQGVMSNVGEEEVVSDSVDDHIVEPSETVEITELRPAETVVTYMSATEIVTDAPEVKEPAPEPVEVKNAVYYDVPLSESLQDHIFTLCEERGIDPKIIIAMIKIESNYNTDNIGDSGASLGLMQIQPRWHEWRLADLGVSDWFNAFDNVTVGIDIFADLYDHSGDLEWALMAYNGGSGYANARAAEGVVTDYVYRVIEYSGSLSTYESVG